MGAWGLETFENDSARDWLYTLEESADLSVIEQAFKLDEDYTYEREGCYALAAAEVVLALLGKARIGLPENATQWVCKHKALDATKVKASAIIAVTRVLSKESVVAEVRGESDDFDIWVRDVNDIKLLLENS